MLSKGEGWRSTKIWISVVVWKCFRVVVYSRHVISGFLYIASGKVVLNYRNSISICCKIGIIRVHWIRYLELLNRIFLLQMSKEQRKNQFEVKLNVSSFHSDDLQVKVNGRQLTVTGHHNEREENGGMVERRFIRTYMLPKSSKENELTSEVTAHGILKITVPTDEAAEYHKIPIKVDPNWKMRSNTCQELIVREPIPLWWWWLVLISTYDGKSDLIFTISLM